MNLSDYKFTEENGTWNIGLKYEKNGRATKFDLDAILELRDRALLIQHTASYGTKERELGLSVEEERKSVEE